MFGQIPAVSPALARRSALLWGCRVPVLDFGCGNTLLEPLQAERPLIGIELLRPSADAMTIDRGDEEIDQDTFCTPAASM